MLFLPRIEMRGVRREVEIEEDEGGEGMEGWRKEACLVVEDLSSHYEY